MLKKLIFFYTDVREFMMRLQKWVTAGIVIVFFLLCCSNNAFALKTTPSYEDVGEIQKNRQYQQIFSLHNDGPKPEKIMLGYDSFSTYFEPYTTINPQQFVLYPGQTQNVQLTLMVSDVFGPQEHTLNLINNFDEKKLFSLKFDIKGVPLHDLRISDVAIFDVSQGEVVSVDVVLSNDGNIISYATPQVIIEKDKQRVGNIAFESLLQILPQEEYSLTLTYTDELGLGEYALRVFFDYDELYTTNEIVRNFAVLDEGTFVKNIKEGERVSITFSDFGIDGGTYIYEVRNDQGIIVDKGESDIFAREVIIKGENFEQGVYEVMFFVNPELENKKYVVRVNVQKKNSLLAIIYMALTLVLLFVLYFLNVHHVFELLWLKHTIRKERIKIQLLEHKLNKLINKTQNLVSTVRVLQ